MILFKRKICNYLFVFFQGKKFIFGDNPNPNIFYRFLFAQFVTSSSEFLAYPLDTIRR
jgi:hypothetical protein